MRDGGTTTTAPPDLRMVRPEAANPFERWMTCNGCGNRILVCGAISDLVDGVYRGVACGCRGPRVPWEAPAGGRA